MNSHLDFDNEGVDGNQLNDYDGPEIRSLLAKELGASAATDFIQLWVILGFLQKRRYALVTMNKPLGPLSCDYPITIADLKDVQQSDEFRKLRNLCDQHQRQHQPSALQIHAVMRLPREPHDQTQTQTERYFREDCTVLGYHAHAHAQVHAQVHGTVTWAHLWRSFSDTSAGLYLSHFKVDATENILNIVFEKVHMPMGSNKRKRQSQASTVLC
jgi:hypothetical protein